MIGIFWASFRKHYYMFRDIMLEHFIFSIPSCGIYKNKQNSSIQWFYLIDILTFEKKKQLQKTSSSKE